MLEARKDPITKTQVDGVDIDKVLRNVSENYEKLDNTSLNYLLICMAKIRIKSSSAKVKNDVTALLNKMKASRGNLFLRIKAQQILDLTNLDEAAVEEIFEPVPGGAIDVAFKR